MVRNVRPLTHDEKKAAEAAFRGIPFDPKWSEAARKVYLGIATAMTNKRNTAFQDMALPEIQKISKRSMVDSESRVRAKSTLW